MKKLRYSGDSIFSKTLYKHDSKENITEETEYSGIGSYPKKLPIIMNMMKEAIGLKQIEFVDNKAKSVFIREIQYY